MSRIEKISGLAKVRAPSLNQGVVYTARPWNRGKEKLTPFEVEFLGYGSVDAPKTGKYEIDVPRLNKVPSDKFFHFKSNKDLYSMKVRNNCVVFDIDSKERRITFAFDENAFYIKKEHKSKQELKQQKIEQEANKNFVEDKKDIVSNNKNKIKLIKTTKEELLIEKCKSRTSLSSLSDSDLISIAKVFGDNGEAEYCFCPMYPKESKNYYNALKIRSLDDILKTSNDYKKPKQFNFAKIIDIDYRIIFRDLPKWKKKSQIESKIDNVDMNNVRFVTDDGDVITNINPIMKEFCFAYVLSHSEQAYGYCMEQLETKQFIDIIVYSVSRKEFEDVVS